MLEFCYELPYEDLDFTDAETRKLYRIGRGEQGVLLVRPYTNDICAHWRFVDEATARDSSAKIYQMFLGFKTKRDFIGMDMARKFLEMGFTRVLVGMLIMPVDGSTMKFLVTPDPKRKIGEPMKSPRLLPYLKRLETWLPMMKPTNK